MREVEYCPPDRKYQGKYAYKHVLWTVEFFDKVFGETHPSEIRDIMRWAALHHQHNLKDNEAKAVQKADRISSGHDRGDKKEDYNKDWSKLAVTCFSDITQNDTDAKEDQAIFIKPHACDHYDSLQELSSSFLNWRKGKDKEEIYKMHKDLWNDLVKWFGHIWNTYQNNPDLLIALLCEMQRKYLTWVPAATNTNNPKVSLYDHQRTTAGFAHCFFQNQNKCHYLILEVSGIQKFIYNVYETKKATKILRGKSTFIELISEAITHKLSQLSITYANIFLNTKGKVSYLLPASIKVNEVHQILNDFKTELNREYGHLIGFHYVLEQNVSYQDFEKKSFQDFQKKIYKKLHQNKLQPLKSFGDKAWDQVNQDVMEIKGELCRYCKEREASLNLSEDEEEKPICTSCNNLYRIGEKDVKKNVRIFSSQSSDNSIKMFEGLYLSYHSDGRSIPNDKSCIFYPNP